MPFYRWAAIGRRVRAMIVGWGIATVGIALWTPVSAQMTTASAQTTAVAFTSAAGTRDEKYTAKIKEYTTEPFFLTEIVDHLPASETIPTPEKVLGYIAGAPNKLTYTKDLYRYYRELAKASPRVRLFTAPERS